MGFGATYIRDFTVINMTCLLSVWFFFPDERNVWRNVIFESITNQELSFAGPYPVAVGCHTGSSLEECSEVCLRGATHQ